MRHITGALIAVAALQHAAEQPSAVLTLVQRDAWQSYSDTPSVAISANGRYIAFASYARLVPADTNDRRDIYVFDRTGGLVTLESVTLDGRASTDDSCHPGLSGDGRFLVYETRVRSAVGPVDARHVVLRDRQAATITVVSADRSGEPANGWSGTPAISEDGRVVAFVSAVTNLVEGLDANGPGLDVYSFDASMRTIRRVSVDSSGVQSSVGFSIEPRLSADGRFVAFASDAALDRRAPTHRADARGRAKSSPQIYFRDSQLNLTRLVNPAARGRTPDGASWKPAISANGRYVVFVSAATNLTEGDRNNSADVFVTDLHAGTTELVSRSVSGGTGNGPSGGPAISTDGRFIAFQSEASDLVCTRRCTAASEDINLLWDVFLFDRQTRVTVRVSADAAGGWLEGSVGPAIDAAGTLVAFSSRRPIGASDQRNDFDLFVHPVQPAVVAAVR